MDRAAFKQELFILGRSIHAKTKESMAPIIAAKGITHHQLHILITLDIQPGLALGKLSEEIGVRKTNFAQVLRHLTAEEFVEVRPCAEDKRTLQAFLTKKGRALLGEVRDETSEKYDALILEQDEEDIRTIMAGFEALKKLLTTMESRRCQCSDTSTHASNR